MRPLGRTIPLLCDVLAEHTAWRPTTTEHAIRPTPEPRLAIPTSQFGPIGFPQQPGGDGFDVVDTGGQEHRWWQLKEEMQVIRFAVALH